MGSGKIERRRWLESIATLVALAPLTRILTACGGGDSTAAPSDAGTNVESGAGADAANETSGAAWATGGTASMTAKATYPSPFAASTVATCAATASLTEGPCYDAKAEAIQDISYGRDGLPMRMHFRVLDAACRPVANATVSIWHCSPTGIYSGDDAAHMNVGFCTGKDADYTSHLYFRGIQTTDANGIVLFDTCFPGWYSSRTIHVHFTVTTSSGATLTSQFVFDDTLDDEIVAGQPLYKARGKRDTTNTSDTVVSASSYRDHLLQTARMTDGAMLAWGTIAMA